MEETRIPTSATRRRSSRRKPLTDLNSEIPSSPLPSSQSSSSSSLIKPTKNSSLSLNLQSPLKTPNGKINSKATLAPLESSSNNGDSEKKEKEKGKGKFQGDKENPSSVPPKTPSAAGTDDVEVSEPSTVYVRRYTAEKRKSKEKEKGNFEGDKENPSSVPPKTPSALGTNDVEVSEPSTVYGRRHTAEKRKSKGKEIMEPLSCTLEMRIPDLRKKKDGDGGINLSKSCPLPRKRKQRRDKAEVNASKPDLHQDFTDEQKAYFAEVNAMFAALDKEDLEEEVASADESE